MGVYASLLGLLPFDDVESFSRWAVGENHRKIDSKDWPEAWNLLHGKKLELNSCGNYITDLRKTIELWEEYKKEISETEKYERVVLGCMLRDFNFIKKCSRCSEQLNFKNELNKTIFYLLIECYRYDDQLNIGEIVSSFSSEQLRYIGEISEFSMHDDQKLLTTLLLA